MGEVDGGAVPSPSNAFENASSKSDAPSNLEIPASVAMGGAHQNITIDVGSTGGKQTVVDDVVGPLVYESTVEDVRKPSLSLPEVDTATFASTGTTLLLPSNQPVSMRARIIAIIVVFTCAFGVLNGADFTVPDSGLYKHRDIIWNFAKDAPQDSAIFSGRILQHDGTPAVNWSVSLSDLSKDPLHTGQNGEFRFQALDPGRMWVQAHNGTHARRWHILLSGPVGFEPGVTHLELILDPSSAWNASLDAEPGVNVYNPEAEEYPNPHYDPSAANYYVMAGFAFIFLSLIGIVIAAIAGRSGDPSMLRLSSVFAFFTMGYYGVGCLLGLLTGLATIWLPSRE